MVIANKFRNVTTSGRGYADMPDIGTKWDHIQQTIGLFRWGHKPNKPESVVVHRLCSACAEVKARELAMSSDVPVWGLERVGLTSPDLGEVRVAS